MEAHRTSDVAGLSHAQVSRSSDYISFLRIRGGVFFTEIIQLVDGDVLHATKSRVKIETLEAINAL